MECEDTLGLPPREPAGVVYMRPLKLTMVRMVVTGRPIRPGSQDGVKFSPSSLRSSSGPGPLAGDQVLTNRLGLRPSLPGYTHMPRKPSSRGIFEPSLPMMVGALNTRFHSSRRGL